ncbi:MAG: MucB/RseB C-terminal domain-containing protein [Gammaproteobacteria bacterium]|nr:MucB/RseB C-terminal domain-containing protein [Gammaproteobacteria bacterium]
MLISSPFRKTLNGSHCCVLMLLLSMMKVAVAEESIDARQWLVKMSTALQQLNYEGTFVYRADDELAAMRVVHQIGPQGDRELLQTLTGEKRESVNENQQFNYFANKMDAESDSIAKHLAEVEKYYLLKMGEKDRVAGRIARIVIVNPKDEYRYGYRLWLDESTGLLLRSDLIAVDGRVIEQVMFTSMAIGKASPRKTPLKPAAGVKGVGSADAKPVINQWRVTKLPAGFSQIESPALKQEGNGVHRIFTDGLASVSLFVEKAKSKDDAFVGVSRMGAVSAFGNLMDGHQLTVVGEVPEATVKMIGASVTH